MRPPTIRSPRQIAATCAALAVLASTALITVVAPAAKADPPITVLVPDRTVGFTGHANLYGWGAATMRDGTVLISDYWNKRVQRFAADGTPLGVFISNPGYAANQHQAPYGLGVDPDTGDVYMADTDRRQVDRYSEDGTFLNSFGANGVAGETPGRFRYPSRVAVQDGLVFIADTWAHRIVVYSPTGTVEEWAYKAPGVLPGQLKHPRGLAFDEQGRLHVVDSANFRVEIFEVDLANETLVYVDQYGGEYPGTDAEDVFRGDLRGLAIDTAAQTVFIVDAEGNRVHKFTTDGDFVSSFGSKGELPGQFLDGGRDLTVDLEGKVWVGDMPNFRVQVFDADGNVLFVRPDPPVPPPLGGFNGPRGVALDDDGNIFVVDTYNERIQKLAPDGTPITAWGHRGRGDYQFNYPRMLAVDQSDGSVVVADTDNHKIKKYDNDGVFQWDVGGRGIAALQFKNPHGVDIGTDGRIYVADTNNARVQILEADGTFVSMFGSFGTGAGQMQRPRALTVDDASGRIFVADSQRNLLMEFQLDGTFVRSIASGGPGAHQLDNPFDVETDTKNVYLADSATNQVKVWNKTSGDYVGTWGGTGTQLGKLKVPLGMDLTPGGELFIAERDNDRISVWDVVSDGDVPTASVNGFAFPRPAGAITLTGSATDDSGVASVGVAIRNTANNQWLQANGTFGGTRARLLATLTAPSQESTSWSYTTTALPAGSFDVEVDAADLAARTSALATTSLTLVTDTVAPNTAIADPTQDEVIIGRPVGITGTATDNVAVDRVQVAVKDRTTLLWWDPTTSTWGPFKWIETTVDVPGASAVGWSYTFDDSANPGSGKYFAQARAGDGRTVWDASAASVRFEVVLGPPDTVAPESSLTAPVANQVYPARPAAFTGGATDDIAVAKVQLGVKDRGNNLWWNPATATWGAFVWFDVAVDSPGATSTTWGYGFDDTANPGSGSYFVQVRSVDASNNVDATPTSARFTITP